MSTGQSVTTVHIEAEPALANQMELGRALFEVMHRVQFGDSRGTFDAVVVNAWQADQPMPTKTITWTVSTTP